MLELTPWTITKLNDNCSEVITAYLPPGHGNIVVDGKHLDKQGPWWSHSKRNMGFEGHQLSATSAHLPPATAKWESHWYSLPHFISEHLRASPHRWAQHRHHNRRAVTGKGLYSPSHRARCGWSIRGSQMSPSSSDFAEAYCEGSLPSSLYRIVSSTSELVIYNRF